MKPKKSSNKPEKPRKSIKQPSLTPRTQSIDSLLSPKPPRRSTSTKYANDTISKSSKLKFNKAEKRLKAKSEQIKELRQAPNLNTGSKKLFKAKTVKEIKVFTVNVLEAVRSEKKLKLDNNQINVLRPQDLIEKPDLACLKGIIERATPKFADEEEKITDLGIVEKTERIMKQKLKNLAHAEEERKRNEMKECTFKPDLSPRIAFKGFHRKSKSQPTASPRLKRKKEENNFVSTQLRPPAPNKFYKKNPATILERGTFVSSTLSKMNPGKRIDAVEITERLKRLSIPSKL